MPRSTHQPLTFLPSNAGRRATIVPARTRPDFDEHQRAIALAHHQIDLSAATRHVARYETQPLALQEGERVSFEGGSDVFGPSAPQKVVSA